MRRKPRQVTTTMPHIGNIIKPYIDNSNLNKTQIGKKMYIAGISLDRYCENPSLQSYILWNLGEALNVNLFEILAKAHPVQPPVTIDPKQLEMQQRITDLEKELAIYKEIVKGKMG